MSDFMVVLDLLDRIQPIRSCSGFSDTVTWSRARHSSALGDPPLRSRANHMAYLGWTLELGTVHSNLTEKQRWCLGLQSKPFVAALCSVGVAPTCPDDLEAFLYTEHRCCGL